MKAPAFGTAKLARPSAVKAPSMPKMAAPKAPAGMTIGAAPSMRTALPKVAPAVSGLAAKLKGVPM